MSKRNRSPHDAPRRDAFEPPPRYEEWIAFAFDKAETQDGWFFDERYRDEVFEATSAELVALFTATMLRSGEDLKRFTDLQVKHGLSYHVNNACGDVTAAIRDQAVPEHLRDEAILSLKTLYADCLGPRCAPVLCSIPNSGVYWEYPLNGFAYMFWDVSPLLSASPRVVMPVLKDALYNDNPACQESALHGIGHLAQVGKRIEMRALVEEYLRDKRPSGPLRDYAEKAAAGLVQ